MVPVKIRDHFVPFLFREFEGKEASYSIRTAKSIVFLPSSSLTSYLYAQINYKKTKRRQDKFLIFLTIDQTVPKTYSGMVYVQKDGVKEKLFLQEQQVRDFNNLIEDIFRMALTYYIDGCLECDLPLYKAIDRFIDKYDLLEVGFDFETLRGLYYREKKTSKLFRFQSKSANRVLNYR